MKDFKVAQIVPVSCFGDIQENHYHMCLAHLVQVDPVYANFYKTMSERGKFVLMDNGAAEGAQLDTLALLKMYEYINPAEIVIPDTLCDSESTLWKAKKFIKHHSDLPYRFMAVPQGKTVDEWCMCASELLTYDRVDTIGISKFLNIATGDPYARFAAAHYILEVSQRMGHPVEVHLLGCDEGPGIVREIQLEVPIVRGCDSAFAYIAAHSGTPITRDMKRPKGEIDFLHGPVIGRLPEYLHAFEKVTGVKSQTDPTYWR